MHHSLVRLLQELAEQKDLSKRTGVLKVERKIMFGGAIAKFSQNDDLQDTLLATNNKTMAERCNDSHWGTGKALYEPTAFYGWEGVNHVGNSLMGFQESVKGD